MLALEPTFSVIFSYKSLVDSQTYHSGDVVLQYADSYIQDR
jgi:hypothetical protein